LASTFAGTNAKPVTVRKSAYAPTAIDNTVIVAHGQIGLVRATVATHLLQAFCYLQPAAGNLAHGPYPACHMALESMPNCSQGETAVPPNVIEVLGGSRAFGPRAARVDLLTEVERGLPRKAYEAVSSALELTPEEEDRLLQVSLRTRARWKGRARLDAATSDRLVRLARILALAVMVLESRPNAIAWLREPSDALGGRSPLAAIASDPGAERVANMLYQMEHGVYA
jgi:putative toxin-antitoxin system antitoxin component (TIGR02293 family)